MNRLESTLRNMILSLGSITLIAGGVLGGVYAITKEPIAKMQHTIQVSAIREVAPSFTNDPESEKWEYTDSTGNKYIIYPAMMNDSIVGAAVESFSMNGFSGEIRVMCGFDYDGTIRNYKILSHSETPGLGSKMQQWFSDTIDSRSIIGKNMNTNSLYVTKDTEHNGEIDAITAATISSRAFLESVRNAYKAYLEYIKAQNIGKNE